MLTRIRLKGFKSFEDVEVKLSPLTVLFGPNAAGKSNFLDALQLVAHLVTSMEVRGAFDSPYRGTPLESFSFGPSGIRGLLAKDTASLYIEIDVYLSDAVIEETNRLSHSYLSNGEGLANSEKTNRQAFVQERHLRYSFTLEISTRSGIVGIADEQLRVLTLKGEEKSLNASLLASGEKHFLYGMAASERAMPSRFSLPMPAMLFPHMYALKLELSRWSFFYFEPRERMREPNAVRETRHIGMMGENIASFLNTLQAVDPEDFKALELSLQMLIPSISGIDVGVDDRGEVELRLREGGTPISSRLLSEGTLRLLGLLALGGAKERPTLVGFEEPENGVHPRRLRLIAELLKSYAESGDMQMIVTTHSPLLLDALPRESLYLCRKVDGRSRITPITELDPLGLETDVAALLDRADDELAVSARLLRGDFDA